MSAMMTVEPQTFVPGVTPNISMLCEPDGVVQQSGVGEMILIEIVKADEVVAIVRPDAEAHLDDGLNPSKYSANGFVDKTDVTKNFLHFSINFPSEEDAATYQCMMSYLDNSQLLQNPREMFQLKANDFQRQLDQALQTVNNLLTRVNTLESQVFNLSINNKNQSTEIIALKERAQSRVAFYATLTDKLDVHVDDVLVFSDVQLNDGDGYNATSGVFVAPVTGLYIFSLVFEVEAPTAVKMDVALRVQDNVISRLFVFGDNSFHGGQASGSVVYQVAAGSEVKAVVTLMNMETESQPRLVNEDLSYFAGFLV
ncbi:hypothetical protein BaRGS_00037802 [Batillaria attramentaria]|uniref:C1q domain-containing protein n=1 Tax=Batillaria attramentaria TaxID=370345 RepID=A0ABD0J7J9_9CAEN